MTINTDYLPPNGVPHPNAEECMKNGTVGFPPVCQQCRYWHTSSCCREFLLGLIPHLEKMIRDTSLFVYDCGTQTVIVGKMIDGVHLNQYDVLQLDLDPDWRTNWDDITVATEIPFKDAAEKGYRGGAGNGPGLLTLANLLRELFSNKLLVIQEDPPQIWISEDMIQNVGVNGESIQISLDPAWYDERNELLRELSREDTQEV